MVIMSTVTIALDNPGIDVIKKISKVSELELGEVTDESVPVNLVVGLYKDWSKTGDKFAAKFRIDWRRSSVKASGMILVYTKSECIESCIQGPDATYALLGKCKRHNVEELIIW